MSMQEEMEQRYLKTYGEKIVFDDVIQRGPYVIASQKKEKERFLQGANGTEYERNSSTYFVFDSTQQTEMKLVISSEGKTEAISGSSDGIKRTEVQFYRDAQLVSGFTAYNVYLDTNDKNDICGFLVGAYPKAEYGAQIPKDKENLFSDWFHCDKEISVLNKKFEKYHRAEVDEINKGLKAARKFYAEFIGSSKDLKLARGKVSVTKRIKKFCQRLALHGQDPDMRFVFNHARSNNRF